jgi:hypothetical protein
MALAQRGPAEVSDRIWLVSFMHYDLGFVEHYRSNHRYADLQYDGEPGSV